MKYFGLASLLFLALFSVSVKTDASEFTSTNFRVLDPVLQTASSTEMSSSNFRLLGTVGQLAIGTSTATNFNISSGFLYFPTVTSPVVTATAGDAKVTLSWTAAQGFLGWTVSGYNVGRSTTAGGPYTYSSSLGNVTTSARTGLTNGTTYYFIVRAEDALGNSIATSSEISSTPVAAPADSGGSGGGGGGGGGGGIFETAPPPTRVILRGRAYPGAQVTIFKDGTVAATPVTDPNGVFQASVDVVGGIYTFSFYATDKDNHRSLTQSFTSNVSKGFTLTVSDIVIAPSIAADKSQVRYGSDIKFFGYSYPSSEINVVINSEHTITDKSASDRTGYWDYAINSQILDRGDHTAKTQTVTPDGVMSPFSESLAFKVGDTDIAFVSKLFAPEAQKVAAACRKNGDINGDGRINIIDFSIMLFFWNQRSPKNACADINQDGAVNIFDFSIMLFWWTG